LRGRALLDNISMAAAVEWRRFNELLARESGGMDVLARLLLMAAEVRLQVVPNGDMLWFAKPSGRDAVGLCWVVAAACHVM
jgi:hypothetical protein